MTPDQTSYKAWGCDMPSIFDRPPPRKLPTPNQRRRTREQFGVTQQELAEEIGVTRQTLNGWEKGIVEPRGENHARYLDVLDRMQQRIDQRVEQGDNT